VRVKWPLVVGLGLLHGCSVDDRTLGRAPVSSYVATNDGTAGEGGSSADLPPTWPFDHGTDGWQAEDGIEEDFNPEDADGESSSGSLDVTNVLRKSSGELWVAGAFQCVSVIEGMEYELSLDVLIPLQEQTGGASVELQFYNVAGCTGLRLQRATFASPKAGAWERLEATRSAPAGAKSALLRLLVAKVYRAPSFSARFDNVTFAPR
jgi:hypothetical protein